MKTIVTIMQWIVLVLLSLFFMATASGTTVSNEKPKKYYIYGDPLPGSKFKQKLLTSPLPFNRSYQEHSEFEKSIIRSSYTNLLESEIPPYPKSGTKMLYKPIIKALRTIKREGQLTAIAMIDSNGKVENVTVYQSPADELTELLNSLLFKTEFDPATCSGEPCKMEYLFQMALTVVPPKTT